MSEYPDIQAAIYAALGCTRVDYKRPKKIDQAAAQIANFVRASAEYQRLIAIEAAAIAWRKSLEDDCWTKDMIEGYPDAFRPGLPELMKLIRVPTA